MDQEQLSVVFSSMKNLAWTALKYMQRTQKQQHFQEKYWWGKGWNARFQILQYN